MHRADVSLIRGMCFLSDEYEEISSVSVAPGSRCLASRDLPRTLAAPYPPVRVITQRQSRWYTRDHASPRAAFLPDARRTFPILTRPPPNEGTSDATLARTIRPNARTMPKPRLITLARLIFENRLMSCVVAPRVLGITCNAIVVNLRHVVTVTRGRRWKKN